jgi:membrane protease YdiL (CAAX protease family)
MAGDVNAREAIRARRSAGTLTWRGPALMLFARTACALAAQAVVAIIFFVRGSATAWHDAEPWLPVYATLIDAGCLTLLWRFTRREGIRLIDLVGFKRTRLVRDILLGLALIPASLVFIFAGTFAAGWIVYRTLSQPHFLGGLPLPATLYSLIVFPILWGTTEQMTYNGYLLPRFQVLSNTAVAIAVVAFVWAAQHAFMPLTFDPKFMTFRLLASVPSSLFETVLYLRLRRLIPFVLAHALMDGATELIPLLRAG